MPRKTFEEMLAEQRRAALLPEVGLTRYQHVERLGNEEVEGLLDGEVIVQTKIDGSCLTVAWYDGPIGLVVATRNNVVYRNGAPVKFPVLDKEGKPKLDENGEPKFETRFDDAVEYVLAHGGIQTLAAMGFILRGEWLIQHSVVYDKEKYGHLYLFDVQWHNGAYVHPYEWIAWAEEHDIRCVPVLTKLNRPSVEALVELTKGPDEFGAPQKEGIVIKRYDGWSNKRGRTTWGKLVSADFTERMHAAMGATNDDPPEIRFVARIVSYDFVMKTIRTIEDSLGRKLVIGDMPQVLGRVWYDAFTEEMWNFVRKEKVGKFDFKTANRLSIQKTRDIALAYFNAVPHVMAQGRPPA